MSSYRKKLLTQGWVAAGSETLAQAGRAEKKPGPAFQLFIFLGAALASSAGASLLATAALWAMQAAGLEGVGTWRRLLPLFACGVEIALPVLYCACVEGRSLRSMGCIRKGWLREYAMGFAAGAALLCASALLAVVCGAVTFQRNGATWSWLILFLAGFLVQGAGEEFLFRGYLMVSLANRLRPAAAVGLSAVAFALLHLGNSGVTALAIVNLALFGVFAGIYMLRRDNIWGVCAFHSAWNFFQGNVLGVSVSGGDMGPSLFCASAGGSALISGGGFGLEGGLAATAGLAAGIALVLLLPKKR